MTLQTANELLVIPQGDVDERKPSEPSMMPDDLWTALSDYEVRSLVAYLASPLAGPDAGDRRERIGLLQRQGSRPDGPATPTSGRSRTARSSARPPGLERNEFLQSDLTRGRLPADVPDQAGEERGQQRHPVPQRESPGRRDEGPTRPTSAPAGGASFTRRTAAACSGPNRPRTTSSPANGTPTRWSPSDLRSGRSSTANRPSSLTTPPCRAGGSSAFSSTQAGRRKSGSRTSNSNSTPASAPVAEAHLP